MSPSGIMMVKASKASAAANMAPTVTTMAAPATWAVAVPMAATPSPSTASGVGFGGSSGSPLRFRGATMLTAAREHLHVVAKPARSTARSAGLSAVCNREGDE